MQAREPAEFDALPGTEYSEPEVFLDGDEDAALSTGNGHFPLSKPDESDFERLHGDALLGHHLKLLDHRYGGYEAEHLETLDGLARLDPSSLDRRRRLAWRLLRRRGWVTTLATGRSGYPVSPILKRVALLAAGRQFGVHRDWARSSPPVRSARGSPVKPPSTERVGSCAAQVAAGPEAGRRPAAWPCAQSRKPWVCVTIRARKVRRPGESRNVTFRCIPLPCQPHMGMEPERRDRRKNRRRSWVPNGVTEQVSHDIGPAASCLRLCTCAGQCLRWRAVRTPQRDRWNASG